MDPLLFVGKPVYEACVAQAKKLADDVEKDFFEASVGAMEGEKFLLITSRKGVFKASVGAMEGRELNLILERDFFELGPSVGSMEGRELNLILES
jgi:hypothetical protein